MISCRCYEIYKYIYLERRTVQKMRKKRKLVFEPRLSTKHTSKSFFVKPLSSPPHEKNCDSTFPSLYPCLARLPMSSLTRHSPLPSPSKNPLPSIADQTKVCSSLWKARSGRLRERSNIYTQSKKVFHKNQNVKKRKGGKRMKNRTFLYGQQTVPLLHIRIYDRYYRIKTTPQPFTAAAAGEKKK